MAQSQCAESGGSGAVCECSLCARAARTVCAHAVRLVTLLRIFFQSKRVAKYEPVFLADGALLLRSQLGDLRVVWEGQAQSEISSKRHR